MITSAAKPQLRLDVAQYAATRAISAQPCDKRYFPRASYGGRAAFRAMAKSIER